MVFIIEDDVIECWFYEDNKSAKWRWKKNAVGYCKTKNGVLVERWGKETDYCYYKSKTKGENKK